MPGGTFRVVLGSDVAAGTTTMVATPHIDYAFEVDPAGDPVDYGVERKYRLQYSLAQERHIVVTDEMGGLVNADLFQIFFADYANEVVGKED